MDLIALDRELDLDRDHPLAHRGVVVHVVLGLPRAVGKLGHALPGQALDVVLHLGERGQHRFPAVLLDQAEDLALGDPRRLGLCMQVALGVARRPRVRDDHLDDVPAVAALVPDPDRRDAQALGEVLFRAHVEGAGNAAADVGPVPVDEGEGDHLALVEDRLHDPHVVEVRAAEVGVVHRVDVLGAHVVPEGLDDRLGRGVQRADVDGDVLAALHDRVAARRRRAPRRSRARRSRTSGTCGGSAPPSGRRSSRTRS